jgi:radical SAM protein with 4Fe4S-binding SPASM domain
MIEDLFQKRIYLTEEYKNMKKQRMKFPILIDLEATNSCNMNCIFCSRQIMTRKISFLSITNFKKIIDEMKLHQPTSIRIVGWGEPTLNKDIVFFIKYASKNNILNHLTTNGLLMDKNLSKDLLDAGLNKIKFSFQGLNEISYNSMRKSNQNNNLYNKITKNIEDFISIRNENKYNCHIQIGVSILKNENNKEQIDKFYNYWIEKVDSIWGLGDPQKYNDEPVFTSFNRIKDKKPQLYKEGRANIKSVCFEPYNKLSIGSEGDIKACCSDFNGYLTLGNIKNNTISDIWDGEKLKKLISDIESGDPSRVPKFCLGCDSYI